MLQKNDINVLTWLALKWNETKDLTKSSKPQRRQYSMSKCAQNIGGDNVVAPQERHKQKARLKDLANNHFGNETKGQPNTFHTRPRSEGRITGSKRRSLKHRLCLMKGTREFIQFMIELLTYCGKRIH